MADLVTGGRDKIPHRPTLLLPNRADIRVLHALEQDLGGSEHISWLADRVQRPGEDVLHYLGRIKARGIFCELEQIEADSLRDMLRREMELGRYVVLLPGHPLQAPGALSDVPGSLLRRLCSLGLPVLPVHAGMISARDDGAVTVSSGDYDVLELRYGEPISPMKPVSALVLAAWMEAQAELYATQQRFDCTLGESIIRSLYARPEMLVIDGVNDTKLDGATLLPLAIALAERLHKQVSQGRVGIILPPGKLCTIAFVACVISGIVPVFINYEATAEEFIHSARRSELTRFITERRFQNKLSDFCWPRERDLIYAESELREVPRGRMAWMRWLPRLQTPESLYRRICLAPPRPEDEAVVIFTGGTDEKPKGISLTHRMLMTGLAEFRSRVQIKRGDRILATMPYGHPLSLMAGLLLPLLGPCDLVTYPTADAGERLCTLARQYEVAMAVSTPRCLQRILAAAEENTFAKIRYFFSVGEKLPETLGDYARGKLGLRLLEAYSLSEIVPLAACEVPGPDASGGTRCFKPSQARGSVGEPLPGVAVRIADPDRVTQVMPTGDLGMIWLKSPTLVNHYIGNEAEAERNNLQRGWLRTNDIGYLNEDGLLTICGRSMRFTKVDGQLRAHEDLEQALLKVLGVDPAKPGRSLAVVGVADDRGVEHLVLLSTLHRQIDSSVYINVEYGLKDAGYRHLVPPHRIVPVNYIPELPNGKLDYRRCIESARKALGYGSAGRAPRPRPRR